MTEKVIMAGFGGQGIMLIGKILAYAGMLEGKEVTWLPSYGPEMRGGTANCEVIVSDKRIGSPVIADTASCALILNKPSLHKFENSVEKTGNLIINSSLIDEKTHRNDVDAYYVDANTIAADLGNAKAANMVMLGAYVSITKIVSLESVKKAFVKVFGEGKKNLLALNEKALQMGASVVSCKMEKALA